MYMCELCLLSNQSEFRFKAQQRASVSVAGAAPRHRMVMRCCRDIALKLMELIIKPEHMRASQLEKAADAAGRQMARKSCVAPPTHAIESRDLDVT